LFAAVIPRKIRKSLEALLEDLRTLPSRIRQYDIYTHIYNQIKSYITNNSLLADLKTEALKPRHWATILTRLALHLPFVDLTLGHLYDANLIGSKKAVAEVLSVAQGEMALEEFLRQVSPPPLSFPPMILPFYSHTSHTHRFATTGATAPSSSCCTRTAFASSRAGICSSPSLRSTSLRSRR